MNEARMADFTKNFSSTKVAVIGDLMLDRYVWGKTERISQEAPVPIVKVNDETYTPGGAANVAANIASLGGNAIIFGTIADDDEYGDRLLKQLVDMGVNTNNVLRTSECVTTLKTRVMANNQQVVRIDREKTNCISQDLAEQMLEQLKTYIASKSIDAVIFEDYAKGTLQKAFAQEIVNYARDRNITTVLDPHTDNPLETQGLTLLTPNRSEAFFLSGRGHARPSDEGPLQDPNLLKVGTDLLNRWKMDLLLITLGAEGMMLFGQDREHPVHIPTKGTEVFDVSGAGDTVTAAFTMGLLGTTSPERAAHLANHAAGAVVRTVGTTPVKLQELKDSLHRTYEQSSVS